MKRNGKHYNKSKLQINKKLINYILLFWIGVLIILALNISNLIAYFTATASSQNIFTIKAEYSIAFDGNGAPGTMPDQEISYNVPTNLNSNSFVYSGYTFNGWNTEVNGTGTAYTDGQSVTNLGDTTLYAQWVVTNGIAEINGTIYSTLQDAIDAVPTDNTPTTIKLLQNTSEALTVNENQNIIFNFQNYIVTNNGSTNVINNYGTINISNGTIRTSAAQGAINNYSGGNLVISGGRIETTTLSSRQAIYNNGGNLTITGSAYLVSASNQRATVQNLASGTLTITGGTIVSTGLTGIVNSASMTIGTQDNDNNPNSITIQGVKYGVDSTTKFNIYDGTIKGKNAAINNPANIENIETGYEKVNSTENIDGATYKIFYLNTVNTVTFNANGGTVTEATRSVPTGEKIGTLPIPSKTGSTFDGWYTLAEGGVKIDNNTIISSDVEYFAHWVSTDVASINGVGYTSLQRAIDDVPTDNTETTITLLRSVSENVTVNANKNIVFDFGTNTISNSTNNAVIINNGTIKIINGEISQSADFAAINNNTTGRVIMTGGTITSTGGKSAIYTIGNGIVEISGDAYLISNASGNTPDGVERGTINTVSTSANTIITGGTIIATDGIGISAVGPLTLGIQGDGEVSTTAPLIKAKKYGIKCSNTFSYYDGIIKSISDTIKGTISDCETGYQKVDGTETIDGTVYRTTYLDSI